MTVLRSREISAPKTLKTHLSSTPVQFSESVTSPYQSPTSMPSSHCPSPNQDTPRSGYYSVSETGPVCRRSLRLASKSDSGHGTVSHGRGSGKRKSVSSVEKVGACLMEEAVDRICDLGLGPEAEGEMGFDSNVQRVGGSEVHEETKGLSSGMGTAFGASSDSGALANEAKGTKKLKLDLNLLPVVDEMLEDESGNRVLSLRSGKRVVKRGKGTVNVGDESVSVQPREEKEKGIEFERNLSVGGVEVVAEKLGKDLSVGGDGGSVKRKRGFSREEKAKGKLADDGSVPEVIDLVDLTLGTGAWKSIDGAVRDDGFMSIDERLGGGNEKENLNADGGGTFNGRWSREEKGKAKLDDSADTRGTVKIAGDSTASDAIHLADRVELQGDEQDMKKELRGREYMERFRDIARRNASRFAHFYNEEEENHLPPEARGDLPSNGTETDIEDWPGPFSTAMKIIKDREKKLNTQMGKCSSNKSKPASVVWVPRKSQGCIGKQMVPSLKELCMKVLADNADAITSLENVPDALRHKLSDMLCDSRKMNGHVFSLLLCGSPTEVRVRDCSWLTEDQFTKSFEGCDTSKLTVLQLDQCGRSMPDYILLSTLAQSPNSLPALTTLSLSGACRLSDIGLSALVSSAPALRSINLNQCSLLTSAGINILADKLGSVLHELYINDCQSVDAVLILPSLKRLEHLEVLSLAGIQTVCDDFVKEFVTVRGHNIKELVLTDCVALTDSSMKAIAETCSELRALDLVNLCKLTDLTMGYLANGCRAIQRLKLRRNTFSDEAIAAFLESSGEVLKELSLNNVKKVGQNTALSLARRSRNLLSLDLSWCRTLTDEDLGLIVDSCLSLKVLKLFGCTQITNVFLDGHSNPEVQIIGLKMSPFLGKIKLPYSESCLSYNSLVSSSF